MAPVLYLYSSPTTHVCAQSIPCPVIVPHVTTNSRPSLTDRFDSFLFRNRIHLDPNLFLRISSSLVSRPVLRPHRPLVPHRISRFTEPTIDTFTFPERLIDSLSTLRSRALSPHPCFYVSHNRPALPLPPTPSRNYPRPGRRLAHIPAQHPPLGLFTTYTYPPLPSVRALPWRGA
ncbi:hypothetical protein C8Q78DRAFT_663235 [Trametes maxima]|nr:hypothetical protein C8Q78DRAFT_663235 [Trametes maxima]